MTATYLWRIVCTLGICLFGTMASAQYPDRPIKLVVPYPPGGVADVMARTLQAPLSEILGQPVVVDNRGGAAGAIGTRLVAQSPADGYTLIFGNNGPSALVPLLQKDAGYDPIGDFAPVSLVATGPLVLFSHSSVPATNLREFVDLARDRPRTIEYASSGTGSLGHLTTELFAQKAGIALVHVPYKGAAPAAASILSGEVKMYLSTTTASLDAGVKAGTVRLLGVSTAASSPLFPGTPAIGGVIADFDVVVWFGILAPRGTPAPVVARLNAALRDVLGREEIRQRFTGYGLVATAGPSAELADRISQEVPKWRSTIDTMGAQTR